MNPSTVMIAVTAALLVACAPPPADEPQFSKKGSGHERPDWRSPREPFPAPANQPPADSPQFAARANEDWVYATGRGRDQSSNPAYVETTTPWIPEYFAGDQKILHDPFRLDWGTTRGQTQDVEFRNRYGARLRGKLFAPRLPYADPHTGGVHNGPFPAVLFIPGRAAPKADSVYTGFADAEGQLQQLAENGYVVFAIGPQGQDGSEYFTPPHPMCDPDGDWRKPQEMGLAEPGDCAGHEGPLPPLAGDYAALYGALEGTNDTGAEAAFLAQAMLEPGESAEAIVDFYDSFRTRFVFAALDGVRWLLSDDNPWADLVDRKHIGVFGHSAGADAAVVAANGDPKKRFAAAVTFDSHGVPPDGTPARVPTLLQYAENMNVEAPWTKAPANERSASFRNYTTLIERRVPAMLLALRGSTHGEWSYVPYRQHNPVAGLGMPFINASSKGDAIGHYYALAWFDRWLYPDRKHDAQRRLFARSFDASADRTSIGSGNYDPVAQANVPYMLDGESVADHLSIWLVSATAFDGERCDDWQAGCRAP